MGSVLAFVRLSRPHFLVGGFLMFGVGATAVVAAPGTGLDGRGYLWGQLLVSAAQITAHYVNEYADVDADRRIVNRTLFSGGSGVLAESRFVPAVALRAAWVSSLVAAVAVVGVAMAVDGSGRRGWLVVLGLGSLAVSWAYSMPPVRLLDRGVGELATSAVVAGAVPLIGALSQEGGVPGRLGWAIAALVPIHLAMMLAFELPDVDADGHSGKRVAAVRLGRAPTISLMAVLSAAAAAVAVGGALIGIVGALPGVALAAGALRRGSPHLLTLGAVAAFVGAGVGVWVEMLSELA